MFTRSTILFCVAVVTTTSGCSTVAQLRGKMAGTKDVVDQAERNGAYDCAPRELALAKAHLMFAATELDQGDLARAQEHVRIAEPNARAALRLSPPARCRVRGVAVAETPTLQDRDGDGIMDDQDRCPEVPEDMDGIEDTDGCPEGLDSDNDGIPDAQDLCLVEAEDMDGYLDADGCPEPDNDLDGVADEVDQCAKEPEDIDGYQDEDGCPDLDNDSDSITDATDRCPNEPGTESEQGCPKSYPNVEVTNTAIRIHQKVHFDFNRARIRAVSFPLLNTVAQVLKDYPNIAVEVQGHTDSRGLDEFNLKLSEARAQAVRDYLVQQGVAVTRLTAHGYGEAQPIESNRTAVGRAANRRVEFIRTDSDAVRQQGQAH